MRLSIFKISIILSIVASALGERIQQAIVDVLIVPRDAYTTGYLGEILLQVIFNAVTESMLTNGAATLDKSLLQNIFNLLLEHPLALDEFQLQIIFNVLNENPNRNTPHKMLNGRFYYFSNRKMRWYEASDTCISMGDSLTSSYSQKQMSALSTYLKNNFPLNRSWWLSGYFWFGRYKVFEYTDWSPGQPYDDGTYDNCIYLRYQNNTGRFQMNVAHCFLESYFICENVRYVKKVILTAHPERNTTAALDESLHQAIINILNAHLKTKFSPFITLVGKSYFFSSNKTSLYVARYYCEYMGASLATINNNEEMAALSTFLKMMYPRDRYWWIQNDKSTAFHDWSTGQPDNDVCNERFIHLWYQNETGRFQMNHGQYNWRLFYICKK